MTAGSQPLPYVVPADGVSGGLESARSKSVLGFDGIKMHRMTDKLCAFISPIQLGRQGV